MEVRAVFFGSIPQSLCQLRTRHRPIGIADHSEHRQFHNEAGSQNVLEIHGNSYKLRCVECDTRFPQDEFDLSEMLPLCPEYGGDVKGDTVMFGEQIPPDVLSIFVDQAE